MDEPIFPPMFDQFSIEIFDQDRAAFVERLRTTGRPTKMRVDDGAEIVIQSAEAYQELLAKLERAETLVGIYRGHDDVRNGRTLPLDEAFQQIRERAREGRPYDDDVDEEAIQAIQEGLDSIARGEGRPAREAFAEIRARVRGEQQGDPSTP
jgi:hypothetical protein